MSEIVKNINEIKEKIRKQQEENERIRKEQEEEEKKRKDAIQQKKKEKKNRELQKKKDLNDGDLDDLDDDLDQKTPNRRAVAIDPDIMSQLDELESKFQEVLERNKILEKRQLEYEESLNQKISTLSVKTDGSITCIEYQKFQSVIDQILKTSVNDELLYKAMDQPIYRDFRMIRKETLSSTMDDMVRYLQELPEEEKNRPPFSYHHQLINQLAKPYFKKEIYKSAIVLFFIYCDRHPEKYSNDTIAMIIKDYFIELVRKTLDYDYE